MKKTLLLQLSPPLRIMMTMTMRMRREMMFVFIGRITNFGDLWAKTGKEVSLLTFLGESGENFNANERF